MPGKMQIFSLSSNRPLAEAVAKKVGVPLGDCTVQHFADGEAMVYINESVRGKHVYVIQSTSNPVNEHLMELLIMIDALKRASAKTINVVMPYYGYARQDRKAKAREPITSKLVANLIESAGATRAITLDLHAPQIQGFFDIPIDDFRAMPLFSKYFSEKGLPMDEVVVVSPDHGGATRARKLAENLNVPIAIIDKRRPRPNVAEVMGIIGNVDGKIAILIDDMIDTAGSISKAVDALIEAGAKEVYTAATHGVLSGPAIERIEASQMKELVITDSIYNEAARNCDKVKVISIDNLLATAIQYIHKDKAVSKLFDDYSKIEL
ncbi:MAG: ribose-phosphate diphosphokinase [Culicoidibacterales bacterium]